MTARTHILTRAFYVFNDSDHLARSEDEEVYRHMMTLIDISKLITARLTMLMLKESKRKRRQ